MPIINILPYCFSYNYEKTEDAMAEKVKTQADDTNEEIAYTDEELELMESFNQIMEIMSEPGEKRTAFLENLANS